MEEKRRILLVDDDRAILASFRDLLLPRGYDVDTAETGREAINKSNTKFYNLAVIDIKLPDMEGTELLANLHKNYPKTKKIMIGRPFPPLAHHARITIGTPSEMKAFWNAWDQIPRSLNG